MSTDSESSLPSEVETYLRDRHSLNWIAAHRAAADFGRRALDGVTEEEMASFPRVRQLLEWEREVNKYFYARTAIHGAAVSGAFYFFSQRSPAWRALGLPLQIGIGAVASIWTASVGTSRYRKLLLEDVFRSSLKPPAELAE